MPNQYSGVGRKNRLQAIEEGKKIYIGSTACKHCGSYEKYVSSYNCAPCSIKKGLEKLSNEELMRPYRTKEKQKRKTQEWRENNQEKYQKQYKNEIHRSKCREYYKNNKETLKNKYLERVYDISIEDYNLLLESQNNKCKICKRKCSSGKSLAVDHNHDSGEVRGLLCKNCNIGLGMFFDNLDFLENAVLYLKSTQS
jgi:hypothetical protein